MQQLILLIRHAQTDYDHRRLAGRIPTVGLSETGLAAAADLGRRLQQVKLKALYASPMKRTQLTAKAIAEGRSLTIRTEPRLAEVDFGSWQGKTFESLRKTKLWETVQTRPSAARFPGGESVIEMQMRGVEAIEAIRAAHSKGVVAAVSHADMIKAITAHYLGMHVDLFQRLDVTHASVTAIAFGDYVPRLLRLSDTGTYEEFAPSTAPKKGKR